MQQSVIHVWDVYEIVLNSKQTFNNPYTDVTVWVDLEGPNFKKRVFGFWDGGNTFRVRITATSPGVWTYVSGATVYDEGLCGKSGGILAIEWTEAEKEENPCRRGMVIATDNGHALQYADGTPFIMVGDTWWPLATYRFRWVDDETERPIGPEMSMKDMARHRRKQGYNTIGMICAFPTWAKDGKPARIKIDDEHNTYIRDAWAACSVDDWFASFRNPELRNKITARDMHNSGGRPFEFPGKVPGYEDLVPDYDRINPEYFKELDKKINWLNDNGFTVFIEATRRDCSKTFKYYYDWPMVYTRFIQYIFARYQANNIIFSPIHFDVKACSLDAKEFNEPINLFIDLYGTPPFGTLLSTNAPGSTKVAYGGIDEQHWKTMDQIGNFRDHEHYWLLEDIFHDEHPVPAINGEPYYSGHISIMTDDKGQLTECIFGNVDSMEDHLNFRSSLYGSILSGAFGGILAGFEGGWSGNVEPEETPYKLWDIMTFPASYQTQYISTFLMTEGERYRDLIPNPDLLFPSKAGHYTGWRGWAYCAATKKRDFILGYTEKDCPHVRLRGLRPYDIYEITYFNPRTGEWLEEKHQLEANTFGSISLPERPDELDWAFKAIRLNEKPRLNPEDEGLVASLDNFKVTYIETDSTK